MTEKLRDRRGLLQFGLVGILGSIAGCSQLRDTSTDSTQSSRAKTSSLTGVGIEFDYSSEKEQVTIEYQGGGPLVAGDLQIRSSDGPEVSWPKLGSTVASSDQRVAQGAEAVIGENIINWPESVSPGETIRLVYLKDGTPTTLAQFTPPGDNTATSTVATGSATPTEASGDSTTETPTSTPTSTPTETPTSTPTSTSTETPTETPTSTPTSTPTETPTETPTSTPTSTPTETPTETPTSTPTSTPTETPTETPTSTPTSTPTETPTETPTSTPTSTPTATPDTTPPEISVFSIENPAGQQLRISFEASEEISDTRVKVSGPQSFLLERQDFSEEETDGGVFRYEATYLVDNDGTYTATLEVATDSSGNDGADGRAVDIDLESESSAELITDFDYSNSPLDNGWGTNNGTPRTNDSNLAASDLGSGRPAHFYHPQEISSGQFVFRGIQNPETYYGFRIDFINPSSQANTNEGYRITIHQRRGYDGKDKWGSVRLMRKAEEFEEVATIVEDHKKNEFDLEIVRKSPEDPFEIRYIGPEQTTEVSVTDITWDSSSYMVISMGSTRQKIDAIDIRE